MLRTSLLPFATVISLGSPAQSWCPPGASWTYTYSNSWTTEGFARFAFIGDTVIGADTCQLIDAFAEGWYYPFDTAFHYDLGPVVTKADDALVSIQTSAGFDTLYWFGATPGDHWGITMDDGSVGFGSITVTDTGSMVIQGVPLRFLVTDTDTILERLGSLHSFMLPWVGYVIDAAGGPLRCYSDVDVQYIDSDWGYGCDSWLGLKGRITLNPQVHPNPGSTHFTLDLPPTPHIITLFDATGRMVLQQRTADQKPMIDTEALPAGLYRISVRDAHGGSFGSSWVKE